MSIIFNRIPESNPKGGLRAWIARTLLIEWSDEFLGNLASRGLCRRRCEVRFMG
jgi:hypothetical protein